MNRLWVVNLTTALLLTACSSGEDGNTRNNCVNNCDVGPADANNVFGVADPADWVTFRADAYRTGYAPEATVGDEVELVWSRPEFLVRDWTAAKPSGVVWGDHLYYPSDEGTLYAFERMTGDVVWSTQLIDRNPGIHGTPHVTASAVFLGTYTGRLHALERETGEEIWKYKIGNVIGSSPVYVPEHHAVYVSHEAPKEDPLPGAGYVTKNDPVTGEPIWVSEKLHHWPHSSVAVHVEQKVVMVGANDGVIHAYDTDTGEELWQRDFESDAEGEADIKTTPAMSESRGLGVFGTWDHHVYALDVRSGEEAWSFDTGGAMQGSPALDDVNGRVFQGSGGNQGLYAIDLETGEELWSADIGSVSSSPALSGDRSRVVVGSSAGKVYALDAQTGDVVWEFETDGPVTASPTLVGDMIYVAARLGSLYALRTK